MKKFTLYFTFTTLSVLGALILVLSTVGIETSRFNNLISKKINKDNNNINLKLNSIRFKLDLKEISLFFFTNNPQIKYREVDIPAKILKVYIDSTSLVKAEARIKKITLSLNQIDILRLKKMSTSFKPSNLTNFINNNVKKGKIKADLDIYLDNKNQFNNFIARGSVSNLKAKIINDIELNKTNFNFFADKTDILIKNVFGTSGPIKISEGDLRVELSSEIKVNSNFKSEVLYNKKLIKYLNLIKEINYINNINDLKANLNNSLSISFDKTYKVKQYDYNINGTIKEANLIFESPLKNKFFDYKINHFSLINSKIKANFDLKKKTLSASGIYSLNESKPRLFNIQNSFTKKLLNLKLDFEYEPLIKLSLINYEKPKGKVANIAINLDKKKENIKINNIKYSEGNNLILVEDLEFNNDEFLSLKKITLKTNKDGKNNNDFTILYGKKISINGAQFDANNLSSFFSLKKKKNNFSTINKEIKIDFTNIIVPLSEKLKNFKLIGKIEKGKFTKISSKGDFGNSNYLDIVMKKDQNSNKKYLEIYSDLTRPLLTEYSFFKGLTGGKLLYSSIIDGDNEISKLKIENFKVIDAPGMVKLLSLADLGGLADLAEGEGLSFDILEINVEKKKNLLKLNEIIAIGPSVSILMEGYLNKETTSLRGTLVPAKTLNKMISKIPVLGDIIIPKEIGEGMFGVSFKIKGPSGKVKTTINPIRTITPRFIQKIIDRNKKVK